MSLPRLADTPSCDPVQQAVVQVLPGGDESRAAQVEVPVAALHPGAYFTTVPDPRSGGSLAVPVGQDLDTGKNLSTCVTDPGKCPASGPSRVARLRLYTTGADAFCGSTVTNGFFNIVVNRLERDATGTVTGVGPDVYQYVTSVTSTGQGTEFVEASLPDVTAPGEYRLRAWNFQTGFANQDLHVFFGDPA